MVVGILEDFGDIEVKELTDSEEDNGEGYKDLYIAFMI